MGKGQVRDRLGTGEGQVRDQTGQDGTGSMPKGLLRLQKSLPVGGGWLNSIIVSVPVPL